MAAKTGTKGRACDGKRRHDSREAAAAALQRLVRKGAFKDWLTVYECPHCDGGFHVGHKPGRRR
ncbi:hypothetical protein N5079_19635 [Planotetraspora sp. A-T 1434]|uniref:hypothetical protein n=1 Tax=Planotetraspora sp. A-T 1434 TaxID=2979219 RepID=UPI0021C134F4|nr:hypothetical protein [Planotetraspora sp. A-T 1434]MCT9932416.1 hypothetical protein [Planotetraspora sp. A-T 1434]